MPKDITSPFTPGRPVPVEFFVGRAGEVTKLLDKVKSSSSGRLEVEFLLGERGIGKSSLASFVRVYCERGLNVLGLHTFLGGVSTLEEMVRRIFDRLLKESTGTQWQGKVKSFFGDRIREVGLFGVSVEFEAPETSLRRLVHDFAPALRNLAEKIKDDKKGILIILDDINGLASSPDFANWLKSIVDEISTSQQPLPLCLLIVGVEDRRSSLVKLQPSLARVFDLIEIRSWTDEETREFFRNAFKRVNVQIDDVALALLSHFAGGLPVLAHEIGDAVFSADEDSRIGFDDAEKGILNAADIVGRKHLEPQVLQFVQSKKYKRILAKLSNLSDETFTRAALLRAPLNKDETKVIDNFLARMKKLDVIENDPEQGRGAYRFTNRLHALYFRMQTPVFHGARRPSLPSDEA